MPSEQRIPDFREALGAEAWDAAMGLAHKSNEQVFVRAFLASLFSQGALSLETRGMGDEGWQRLVTPWRTVPDAE